MDQHNPRGSSLALLLQLATPVLMAIDAGQSWSQTQSTIPAEQRSAVQALCFAVLRRWGLARALRAQLAPRKPPAAVDASLRAALALLCAQDQDPPPTGAVFAPHVVVSQAVQAMKAQPRLAAYASFANACLRRFVREKPHLLASVAHDWAARFHHPAWWVKRLQADWPADWERIIQASLHMPPLTLRVNLSKSSRKQLLHAFERDGFVSAGQAVPVFDTGLALHRSLPVSKLPGYSEGWFSVQDAAAQMAAPLLLNAMLKHAVRLDPAAPFRVLDACAAPGGKTSHLMELAASRGDRVQVLALDVDAKRCQRIHENMNRLGFTVEVKTADAAEPQVWHDGMGFDAVLLDAPCTASGIVRRHPDIVWLRRDSDVDNLSAAQARLLNVLWPLLRRGGVLLYCTCSIFKAEGVEQIEAFVARNTDAQLLPSPGHLLPGNTASSGLIADNGAGDHDGFFYALLRKAL